ncbi:MAG: hypothetical protein JNM89_15685 [Hyphomicrobiaceae bacterium]|nr:hypothetical protein [Hyphomicrobiaceae bacterium]
MALHTYVVHWDHGFAPNPFQGFCTLATCKPAIRKKAEIGHWVLGTGSAARKCPAGGKYQGRAIFIMKVTKIITFNEYWDGPEYQCKRPIMNGSLRQRFGDNIYHQNPEGHWIQADSRHSLNGQPNEKNLKRDTRTTDRVLIGREFTYWGEDAPLIPSQFADFVIARPGDKTITDPVAIAEFVKWAKSDGLSGRVGDPLDWRSERRWK